MRRLKVLLVCFPVAVAAQENSDADVSAQFHSGWESHYFSEGRDVLDGDGLWTTSIDLAWSFLSGRIWYASSPQTRYDEAQFEISASHNVGDVELYFAYKHLEFPIDDADDDEIAVGFTWSGLPADTEFSADFVYSVEAEGSFVDLAVGRGFDVTERLNVTASGIFSINEGFVTAGHSGANNVRLLLESEYAINDSISVTAYAGNSWDIDRDSSRPDDELLIDFFHGGIGIRWSFGNQN